MIEAFFRFERFVMRWTMRAAMTFLVLACAVAFYQVVTRFVFEQPSTWSEVTARALDIWMVYLGVAVAFRMGSMMAVDFLIERVSGVVRVALLALIAGVTLAVLGVMAWQGFAMVQRVRFQSLAGITNPITGEDVSIAVVYAAIPTGAALAMLGVVARLVEQLRAARADAPEPARREILEV